MTCAIVYSSRTGNTKQLAEAVRASLGEQTCLYMGPPDDRALTADRLYVGFWTDKGPAMRQPRVFSPKSAERKCSCLALRALGASRHTLKAS